MNEAPSCPECGRLLPANAPGGLCPACLFGGVPDGAGEEAAAGPDLPELDELDRLFPEFECRRLIGRGGMGAVYEAYHAELDRRVAIKVLPREAARDPEFTERFRREARALASLQHPHIVTLHDFGKREGLLYFVMEFVDGTDLAQRIAARSITTDEALEYVVQICEALDYSHRKGVVHRDIKPANILLDSKGRVKIADFGLAKLVGNSDHELGLTLTNAAVGTPRYMAPEQMENAASTDHRVDIYALGVVFYELLTGEVPAGRFDPPSRRRPGLGDHFDEVVLRAMDRDPTGRFSDIEEVKTGIGSALELRRTAPGGSRQVARRFFLFRALPVALGTGGVAAGAVWWTMHQRRKDPASPRTTPTRSGLLDLRAGRLGGLDDLPPEMASRRDLVAIELGGLAGQLFGLALTSSGQIITWGDNRYGQAEAPRTIHSARQIAAACGAKGAHALALLDDDTVAGWGDNSYGQAAIAESDVQAVAAGEFHSVVLLKSGAVKVHGHSAGGVTSVPDLQPVQAIASGAAFCLALTTDGEAMPWGSNRAGECDVPQWVRENPIKAIAAGDSHALALTEDGAVYGWGENRDGQCRVPDDLGEVHAVDAGANGSAAFTADGLRTWGAVEGIIPGAAFALAIGRGAVGWLED